MIGKLLSAALLVGLASSGASAASSRVVAPDGTVHRVEVDAGTPGSKRVVTALRHVRQLPLGGTESALVPGTDDVEEDANPSLAADSGSGAMVLVWSRADSGGFVVYAARWSDGVWSAPSPIAATGTDRVKPQVRVGRDLAHLFWLRESPTGTVAERVAIDRTTLQRAYGPETLATEGVSYIPASGDDGSSAEPPADDLYFAEALSGATPSDPGRVIVWGTRDEPVPFGFIQGFTLRDDARGNLEVETAWVCGRFVLWVGNSAKLYYTWRRDGRWSELRVVETGPGFSAADGKRAIADAIGLEVPQP